MPLDAQLAMSASTGDAAGVRDALARGADVGGRSNRRRTVLFWAFDAEIARILLDAGADCGARDLNGETPIFESARQGRADVLRVLTACGAGVSARDIRGNVPLSFAGTAAAARVLIGAGASMEAVNLAGDSPLFAACGRPGNDPAAAALIAVGADIWSANSAGETVLHRSSRAGRHDIADALVEAGAQPDSADIVGETPLMASLSRGVKWRDAKKVIVCLLAGGADPGIRASDGKTAAEKAAAFGKRAAARLLAKAGG